MTRPTGPAWTRVHALIQTYAREHCHAAMHDLAPEVDLDEDELCDCGGTQHDHEAERQRALDAIERFVARASIGRGSRARYRRAVVDYVHEQERQAARCAAQGGLRVIYRDCLHRDHTESMKRISGRHARAAARARRILATLDGQP
jgi:hypothetical protein